LARGKYKAKAEAKEALDLIDSLRIQVSKLTKENAVLKEHLDKSIQQHAFQIAQMHQYVVEKSTPQILILQEENRMLKRALRGENSP